MTIAARAPVQPGEAAPDFSLPAVDHEGRVSLADYRGRSPLLLAIFRGLYCPFCRRAIAQFGATREKLRQAGVDCLAVVATDCDNAKLYFKLRPARVPLAADPELTTHRAYGLPAPVMDEKMMAAVQSVKINPTGELPEPMMPFDASAALEKMQGYAKTETDQRDFERQGLQLKGQFLLDREGIVRWANVECANDGVAGFGKFPTDDELLRAVRTLN
jgi:peroxiredoxin